MDKPLAETPLALAGWDAWLEWADAAQVWWTRQTAGAAPARLARLVRTARDASPLFGGLLAGIPDDAPLSALPVTRKADLMACFDAWCTDRRVRRADVEMFLADRARIGEPFLERYAVWKTSGTSGTPGYFVQSPHALAVYEALVMDHYERSGVDARRVLAAGARRALVAAADDHFASVGLWRHLERTGAGAPALTCSVLEPIASIVARLNAFQPAFLAGYPSALLLLSREQAAGRLHIEPALLWSGGEHLGEEACAEMELAFDCPVMNEYGASECLCIAHGCPEGWLHVDDDWVLLEPVDENGRPVAPGKVSHTVLLTNLANDLQPIIRYDLGDRVSVRGGACPCGDPGMAIRVEGRADDTLHVHGTHGASCALLPLALTTILDEACGEHRYQLVQTAANGLRLRLPVSLSAHQREQVARRCIGTLRALLARHGVHGVRLALDRAPPRLDPASGKLKSVLVQPCRTPSPR